MPLKPNPPKPGVPEDAERHARDVADMLERPWAWGLLPQDAERLRKEAGQNDMRPVPLPEPEKPAEPDPPALDPEPPAVSVSEQEKPAPKKRGRPSKKEAASNED